jgi:hypothetical protein
MNWFFEKKIIHLKKMSSASELIIHCTVLKKNYSLKKVNNEEEKQPRVALIKPTF